MNRFLKVPRACTDRSATLAGRSHSTSWRLAMAASAARASRAAGRKAKLKESSYG
jgi:hypothetical protein